MPPPEILTPTAGPFGPPSFDTLAQLGQGGSLEAVLDTLGECLIRTLPGSAWMVLLAHPEGAGMHFHYVRQGGPLPFQRPPEEAFTLAPGLGSLAQAVLEQGPVSSGPLATDPHWCYAPDIWRHSGLQAAWAYPLRDGNNRCTGALGLLFHAPPPHGAEAQATWQHLECMARLASLGLTLHQQHTALHDSRQELAHVLSAIGEGVWDWNVHTNQVTHNLRWCAMMGLPPDYLHHPLEEFLALVHPEDLPRVELAIQSCLAGAGPYQSEHRMRHARGHYVWVRDRGNVVEHDQEGKPARLIGSIADISTEMEAEQHLRLTASVFQHAHEGIVITDPAACIIEVNDTFCAITGYAREEVLGRNTRFLRSGHQDRSFYGQMWAELLEKGVWHGEMWNRKKNGELYAQLSNISAVRNEHGKIIQFVGLFSDITALKESQRHLEHLAYHDALTQLPNRSLLADRMRMALLQAERNHTLTAVAYLDLDNFKPVNDQYTHATGDRLLVEVARRLLQTTRAGDTVARMGGDEFALIYNGLQTPDECEQVVHRLLARLAEPILLDGQALQLTASIGMTLYPLDGSDPDTLLRHADQAMYMAKQAGGNCFHMFDPERDRRLRAHREALERVDAALHDGELELHYQPKVDARSNAVIGVEALIRWRHPHLGLLRPAEFLPIALDTEFEAQLGDWALATALHDMETLLGHGYVLPVSVNITPHHLTHPDFIPSLSALLAAHPRLPAGVLELEILESTAMGDIDAVAEIIAACHRLGVSFALDDFGTGYASLTWLRRLPVQTIKIDQSFVRNMLEDSEDLAIVQGVISLAAAFRRQVIAEGVESTDHSQILTALGCHLLQGYGVARPMPLTQLRVWLQARQQSDTRSALPAPTAK